MPPEDRNYLEKIERKSWGKYPSQKNKTREETNANVNKHFAHTSVKQMLSSVNEILDYFPSVPLSTLSVDAVVPDYNDYNEYNDYNDDFSDYYNVFEELAVVYNANE